MIFPSWNRNSSTLMGGLASALILAASPLWASDGGGGDRGGSFGIQYEYEPDQDEDDKIYQRLEPDLRIGINFKVETNAGKIVEAFDSYEESGNSLDDYARSLYMERVGNFDSAPSDGGQTHGELWSLDDQNGEANSTAPTFTGLQLYVRRPNPFGIELEFIPGPSDEPFYSYGLLGTTWEQHFSENFGSQNRKYFTPDFRGFSNGATWSEANGEQDEGQEDLDYSIGATWRFHSGSNSLYGGLGTLYLSYSDDLQPLDLGSNNEVATEDQNSEAANDTPPVNQERLSKLIRNIPDVFLRDEYQRMPGSVLINGRRIQLIRTEDYDGESGFSANRNRQRYLDIQKSFGGF